MWAEIKIILPSEKSNNTIGRPIVPFRKVMDGILYVLRTGCHLCLDKGYDFPEIQISSFKRRYIPHIRYRGEGRIMKIGYSARR